MERVKPGLIPCLRKKWKKQFSEGEEVRVKNDAARGNLTEAAVVHSRATWRQGEAG